MEKYSDNEILKMRDAPEEEDEKEREERERKEKEK